MMLSDRDIAWAAGFLEGEGCFALNRKTCCITAAQVQREPLERLLRLFGGKIYDIKRKSSKHQDFSRWDLHGPKAAGLMMTLWSLMSPRRRDQIGKALAVWRAAPLTDAERLKVRGTCRRGHDLSTEGYVNNLGYRVCRPCMRISQMKYAERRRAAMQQGV